MAAEVFTTPAASAGGPGKGGGAGTALDPYLRVTIAGTVVDLPGNRLALADITTYTPNGDPRGTLYLAGGSLAELPGAVLGKSVVIAASWDNAVTWRTLLDGECQAWPHTFQVDGGWLREYHVVGKRGLGFRVPHTDENTGGNLTVYNADRADITNYATSRAGRSVGAIVRDMLDGPTNAAALAAAGIGNYATVGNGARATATVLAGVVSATVDSGGTGYGTGANLPRVVLVGGGSGAAATAALSGGGVGSITVTSGGKGFTSAPAVTLAGGGGSGATAAATLQYGQVIGVEVTAPGGGYTSPPTVTFTQGHYTSAAATVSGGAVTGVSVTGSADYQSAPEVWISPLPAATLADLAALTLVPQRPVYAGGDSLLDAISDLVRQHAPARHVWLDQDSSNTIRVLDDRAFSGPTALAVGAADRLPPWGVSLTRSISDCYQRVLVRGGPDVAPVIVETRPPTGTGAAFSVSTSGGAVTSVSVIDGGAGYTPSTVLTVRGVSGGSGATCTATVTDGAITAVAVGVGGSGYAGGATITAAGGGAGGLEEYFQHDGLTNAQAKGLWSLDDWEQPTAAVGRARVAAAWTLAGPTFTLTGLSLSFAGWGYEPSTAYNLVFSGGSGTAATATLTTDASGRGVSVAITGAGSYTTTPTVTAPAPPNPNRDEGTCTLGSTSTVTIRSADVSRNAAADYWGPGNRAAHIFLRDDATPGINSTFSSPILSHAALAAGGTATVTLEIPAPATSYTSYTIVATQGGAQNVWRCYHLTDPNHAGRVQQRFPRAVPNTFANGQGATMTYAPTCTVQYSSSGNPPFIENSVGIDVDPENDLIYTTAPVVLLNGDIDNLRIGGDSTDGIPSNVRCLVAINRGTLQAVWPPDGVGGATYAGDSFDNEGLTNTRILSVPEWRDTVNSAHALDYARQLHAAVSDGVWEGTIELLRFHGPLLTTFGQAVQITAPYVQPWDGVALPVVEARLQVSSGLGAVRYRTSLAVSTRRQPLSAEHFALAADRTGLDVTAGLEGLAGLDPSELAPVLGGVAPGAADLRPRAAEDYLGSPAAVQATLARNADAAAAPYQDAAARRFGGYQGRAAENLDAILQATGRRVQSGGGSDGDPSTAAHRRRAALDRLRGVATPGDPPGVMMDVGGGGGG